MAEGTFLIRINESGMCNEQLRTKASRVDLHKRSSSVFGASWKKEAEGRQTQTIKMF